MDESHTYQIRVKGHLDEEWAEWFPNLTATNLDNGEAQLEGSLPDQAALQGVLNRISDLGLVLISLDGSDES